MSFKLVLLYRTLACSALALLGLSSLSSSASAQVIYEPVQSQYRVGGECFYYGGSNPAAIDHATRKLTCVQNAGEQREGRPGVGYLRRNLVNRPAEYTVSDCAPRQNAVVYGYTANDARNEAYARVPTFFRMADLLALAAVSPAAPDGRGVIVPAQSSGTIEIRPSRPAAPATRPATQPKPVLVIPKSAVEVI